MNTNEILEAQFRTFVMMAKLLKEHNVSSWTVYVFRANAVLAQIKRNETLVFDMSELTAA